MGHDFQLYAAIIWVHTCKCPTDYLNNEPKFIPWFAQFHYGERNDHFQHYSAVQQFTSDTSTQYIRRVSILFTVFIFRSFVYACFRTYVFNDLSWAHMRRNMRFYISHSFIIYTNKCQQIMCIPFELKFLFSKNKYFARREKKRNNQFQADNIIYFFFRLFNSVATNSANEVPKKIYIIWILIFGFLP